MTIDFSESWDVPPTEGHFIRIEGWTRWYRVPEGMDRAEAKKQLQEHVLGGGRA